MDVLDFATDTTNTAIWWPGTANRKNVNLVICFL